MSRSHEVGVVAHLAICGRVLNNRTELLACKVVVGIVVDNQLDAERLATGEQYIECLREDIFVYKEHIASLLHCLA